MFLYNCKALVNLDSIKRKREIEKHLKIFDRDLNKYVFLPREGVYAYKYMDS